MEDEPHTNAEDGNLILGPRMILMFAQSRGLLNRQRNHFQKIKNEKQPKTKEDDLCEWGSRIVKIKEK